MERGSGMRMIASPGPGRLVERVVTTAHCPHERSATRRGTGVLRRPCGDLGRPVPGRRTRLRTGRGRTGSAARRHRARPRRGTGRALGQLRQHVGEAGLVVAIDVTWHMLTAARDAGRDRDAALVLADSVRLPLADSSCDAVFAAGIIHHLPEPDHGLIELRRVTRPIGAPRDLPPDRPRCTRRPARPNAVRPGPPQRAQPRPPARTSRLDVERPRRQRRALPRPRERGSDPYSSGSRRSARRSSGVTAAGQPVGIESLTPVLAAAVLGAFRERRLPWTACSA